MFPREFATETARLSDVLCAINLLTWDARTQMPKAADAGRAHQIATLTSLARQCATGPRMQDAIASAGNRPEAMDADERAVLSNFAGTIEILGRVPESLLVGIAGLRVTGQTAWLAAREANDYALFSPTLARIFALQRELADAIGFDAHPYDALIGLYEDGMTLGRLRPLLAVLRDGIAPLLARAEAVAGSSIAGPFPVKAQRRLSAMLARKVGYDFSRGRLDDTVHPFEISMTPDDVRITSRYRPEHVGGLFATLHEAGHGIYEQNVAPCWTRGAASLDMLNLYATGGRSFGLHESQSRLYENRVGRSRRFWELHFGELRDAFPQALAGVTADAFWRAVNCPRRGLIRVEADELTYDAHIMLRVELEAAMLAGEISVADLPRLWDERMARDFGLAVPDLAHGVLQDVHWSSGHVGSFATYTLGNVMSSQFFAAASRDPSVASGLEEGRYEALMAWLGDKVHRHGRSRDRERLLGDATGSGLDPEPYLADLRAKTEALTGGRA